MQQAGPSPRFEDVTETTGIPISREGANMLYTRYQRAAGLARGKRVLEVGCGAGPGLGLIARSARSLIGGDYSAALLGTARSHYGSRVPLVRLSAETLPFRNEAFDLVLFFEASYYVPDMGAAFRELARILDPRGSVLFVNANPERADFIRSPHSIHYHSADEFRTDLHDAGFQVTVEGAFPVGVPGGKGRVLARVSSLARRGLETLGLVPRTLKGRARLKRLIYGRLLTVPAELPEGYAGVAEGTPLETPGPVTGFKVIYVLGRRPE